jgi:hypothetical protein
MPFRIKIVKGISFASNSNFNLAIFYANFPVFQTQGVTMPLDRDFGNLVIATRFSLLRWLGDSNAD